jgi:uncharacterized protein YdiU (UPF0061 family)
MKYLGSQQKQPDGSPLPYHAISSYLEEIRRIAEDEFLVYFNTYYHEVKRQKLGFLSISTSAAVHSEEESGTETETETERLVIDTLWDEVLKLMKETQCDYTIFFRELSDEGGSGRDLKHAHNVGKDSEVFHQWLHRVVYQSSYFIPDDHHVDHNDYQAHKHAKISLSTSLEDAWFVWFQKYYNAIQVCLFFVVQVFIEIHLFEFLFTRTMRSVHHSILLNMRINVKS